MNILMNDTRSSHKRRQTVSPLTERTSYSWSDDKAQSESRTDHPQTFGTVLFISDISNISLCHRDVTSSQSIQDTAEEQNSYE